MKIKVDFSIFTAGGEAVGRVDGELELVATPMLGDTISMMFAPDGTAAPLGHEFGGQLKVIDRVIRPSQDNDGITIMLSDLIVDTREHALDFVGYFESRYGLYASIYRE